MKFNKSSRISYLIEIINEAKIAYYNNTSIIDDAAYDLLVDELSNLDPNNPTLLEVDAPSTHQEWEKAKHTISMGSLDKTNTPEETKKWIDDTIPNSKEFFWAEKADGLSIFLQYENGKLSKAITRGGGDGFGELITPNVAKMAGIKRTLDNKMSFAMRGEIVMLKENHKKYFSDYSNPRNAASGISRRLDGTGCEHLNVICYQFESKDIKFATDGDQYKYIQSLGFTTPAYGVCSGDNKFEQLQQVWQKYQDSIRINLPYEIDGLVISSNEMSIQNKLGIKRNRPVAKRAWKFLNQVASTNVEGVEWSVKGTGRLNPVCIVKPIEILGSVVSRASVYNYRNIEELGLGIGATVNICKANEIIPTILGVSSPAETVFKVPTECPDCHGPVEDQGVYIVCISTDTCPAQRIGRIQRWINEHNVLEWGNKLVEKLVETGLVKELSDLYKLTPEGLASIERMGEKSARKCYESLWSKNPITLQSFLGGMSIPIIASSSIELIMEAGIDTLDKIMNASEKQFAAIKGMGEARSSSLFQGLRKNKKVIEDLLQLGVKIGNITKENNMSNSNKLNGMNICVTGKTDTKRADLQKLIEENGGKFETKVGKTCTHLMMADFSSATVKAEAAQAKGIALLSEADFFNILNA